MTSTDSARRSAPPSADPRAPTKESIDALLDATVDVPNRFYRYPAARGLLPILGRISWLTPNHVTYIHILFGLTAAGIVAFTEGHRWLIIAFVLHEVRMILDCFDGVLARARGSSSPFGRALDEIGDTIATISLTCAITYRLHLGATGLFVACALLAFGGLCANAWDFYKRKLTTALREGKDGPLEELRQKKAAFDGGDKTALAYWGIYFDCFQVLLYEVRPESGDAASAIRQRATSPGIRRFAGLLGFMSFDNGLSILGIGVLSGYLWQSELFIVAYCFLMWIITMISARVVLRDGERVLA